jgi:hypothetical protein
MCRRSGREAQATSGQKARSTGQLCAKRVLESASSCGPRWPDCASTASRQAPVPPFPHQRDQRHSESGPLRLAVGAAAWGLDAVLRHPAERANRERSGRQPHPLAQESSSHRWRGCSAQSHWGPLRGWECAPLICTNDLPSTCRDHDCVPGLPWPPPFQNLGIQLPPKDMHVQYM